MAFYLFDLKGRLVGHGGFLVFQPRQLYSPATGQFLELVYVWSFPEQEVFSFSFGSEGNLLAGGCKSLVSKLIL
ncbi:hypothetical protein V2J09_002063 [Rumex salicifolius]